MSLPDRFWNIDNPHDLLWPLAQNLRSSIGQQRRDEADDALELYFGNTKNSITSVLASLGGFTAVERPSANVIQWCTDTLVAHIVRNKVRPLFLTDMGNAELQDKAQAMQFAIEAAFEEHQIYGIEGTKICFDGNLFEAGGMMFTPDFANMRAIGDRVFPWDVFVSEKESLYGKPRQMMYVQTIDRAVVLETLGADADQKTRDAIENAPPASYDIVTRNDWQFGESDISDQILVTTAWHLPSAPVDREDDKSWDEKEAPHDGRMVTCIEGATISNKPWCYDYFPIAWFKPLPKPVGYWSRSVPETLAGEQIALNRYNTRIDGILNLHARPLLLLWKAAKIDPKLITNAWANIILSSVPPSQALTHVMPQSLPSELFAQVERIISWSEKKLGISEMSIEARKPPGIDHAPGMQHLAETESVRHTPQFRAWENFHLDAARINTDMFRQLAKHAKSRGERFEIVWGASEYLKRFDWSEIDLGENRYHLKIWPTNLLPQTPGAKASRVIEFLREGVFTREQALASLEFPDIKAVMGDSVAARENIERRLLRLTKGENYSENMPHPYLNLEMARTIAQERINRLEADGANDGAIEPLRQFYKDCTLEIRRQQAAEVQAQQGTAPVTGPEGGAMPGTTIEGQPAPAMGPTNGASAPGM